MDQTATRNRFLSGNFAPIWTESDAYALPIVGALPKDLNGTLYRNGPNPQFMPVSPHHHWFGGDGMIHAFTIEDGRVRYRNRWVRTPKWHTEHKAGRPLIDPFGPPDPALGDAGDLQSVANTNILMHGGRLLALEELSLPMQIEASTLATRGFCNFGGALQGPFTAHPKIDPVTGEMLFFGYCATGPFSPDIVVGAVDRTGRVTRLETFRAPYTSLVHDFIATERHILIPVLPVVGSLERAEAGRPPFAWEPDRGGFVGLLRRGAPVSSLRWFQTESCYVYHVMNAREDRSRVVAEVVQYDEPALFPWPDGTPTDPRRNRGRLCRWTFALDDNTDSFKREYIDDLRAEFPRLDERRAGLPYRHGFYACSTFTGEQGRDFNAIAHIDVASGRRAVYVLPEGDVPSEPVFAPRRADAEEGDGFLLLVVWRAEERRSDLVILDAQAIETGPVAVVQLSHRIPFGFHGNWVPAA